MNTGGGPSAMNLASSGETASCPVGGNARKPHTLFHAGQSGGPAHSAGVTAIRLSRCDAQPSSSRSLIGPQADASAEAVDVRPHDEIDAQPGDPPLDDVPKLAESRRSVRMDIARRQHGVRERHAHFGLAGQLRGGAQMVQDEMPDEEVRPRAQLGRGFVELALDRFEKLVEDDPGLRQRIARAR